MKNRIKRSFNIILITIVSFIIVIVFILNIFRTPKKFSEQENRNLAQKPVFSTKDYFSKDYYKAFNSYISDQFPGRNLLVSLKTKIDMTLGKNDINGVYIGKENILSQDFKISSEEETSKKIGAINSFYQKNGNINTSVMIVPTATSILKDKLPKNAIVDDEISYINSLKEKLDPNIKFIDTVSQLEENADSYLYYKTDHHWTTDAAFIAYRLFCEASGFEEPSIDDYDKEEISNNFSGSLNSKIGLQLNLDTIKAYIPKKDEDNELIVNYVTEQEKTTSLYDTSFLNQKDQYEVFMKGNHPLVDIQTLKDQKNKLLVIKDSYANSFIPFITKNYGEIFVVDLRYYMDDINQLIKDNGINNILYLYNANTFNSDDSILNLNN